MTTRVPFTAEDPSGNPVTLYRQQTVSSRIRKGQVVGPEGEPLNCQDSDADGWKLYVCVLTGTTYRSDDSDAP